jgi:MFS family permease
MTNDTTKYTVAPGSGAMKMVVAASSAGTAFEWYDFFVFGALSAVIAKAFFSGVPATEGFIFTLAVFGVGFAVRPIGALVFGWLGDKVGRKTTFVVTVSLMGLATVGMGFAPTYAQAGMVSPWLLIGLRVIQGFALGGEYGGAATYVAEHAPREKRAQYSGWIQISATLGLFAALTVILITRKAVGEVAFADWGWRVPFLASAALLAVSLWMRTTLGESPAFKAMQAEGTESRAPIAESFLHWRYLKLVLISLFSIVIAQGSVWYLVYFYMQFFLEKVLKLDSANVNLFMIVACAVSAPLYVLLGALSDKIGRKPVMLAGMVCSVVLIFPAFHQMARAADPALAAAQARAPVTVTADPADCALQFDPIGKAVFLSSCDIAKSVLTNGGVSYVNRAGPAGSLATIGVAGRTIVSPSAKGLPSAKAKMARSGTEASIKAALKAAGYPLAPDPRQTNWLALFGWMCVLMVPSSAIYAPLGVTMVELFPTRIRYTAMSLPYNIGIGWIGGFLPAVSFALAAAMGNMFAGLWYSVVIAIVATIVTALFLPETRGRDLYAEYD